MSGTGPYGRIYEEVRAIPRGKVCTYGLVARMAGLPGHARQVGYALHRLPGGSSVPWHRVVGSGGRISLGEGTFSGSLQRALLEREGVRFGAGGRVDLARHLWSGGPL